MSQPGKPVVYNVKLLGRIAMEKLGARLPGWWTSQHGAVLTMRDAIAADFEGVFIAEGQSRDPKD